MFTKKDTERFERLSNSKKKCMNCGHTFLWMTRKPFVICSYCGHKVYASEQDEFKDKLKISMLKNSKK